MKTQNFKTIALFTALLSLLFFLACDDDDDVVIVPPDSTRNIVQIAQNDANLSSLVQALQKAELVGILAGDDVYTVLAPTNDAFDDFLMENGFGTLDDVPKELLRQVLLNHVVEGILLSNADTGYYSTMATADAAPDDGKMALFYNQEDGAVFNGESEIIGGAANIEASNGYIHLVDEVVSLPTVADFIEADPLFEVLEDQLDADGQPDFDAILATPVGGDTAPFTVFAPVNDAFALLDGAPTGDNLTAVLRHHVIPNNNLVYDAITNGMDSPATLEGNVLSFQRIGSLVGITDGAGNSNAEVILDLANLQANNGVVHGVDRVLLP
ncbi:fasciclin domain-containing protein [Maribacter sp. 2307ULW6-5]|uniref:fasciclin domain-containing protein n=1 Tax=Maribacter sp. 2307ULW6-5 TaxID=3386275 RepID=UPI0039BC67D2